MRGRPAATGLAIVALLAVVRPALALPSAAGALGLPAPLEIAASRGTYPPGTHLARNRPHPAVARIVVPEGNAAVSYGSGTLVDVRDQFALVVTNWHVVRDGTGDVEVIFPDGFRSKARPLKVDPDWDLAALVIWRPPVPPVALADAAPQPGDQLTICGYGSGQYRAATGRCTQYYAPALDLPQHMVELDVEARQGDSGGPIFNERGELAGVLFGAGRGTTLGSFGGRVESFLATLAPDIGRAADAALVQSASPPPASGMEANAASAVITAAKPASRATPVVAASAATAPQPQAPAAAAPPVSLASAEADISPDNDWQAARQPAAIEQPPTIAPGRPSNFYSHAKNVLAVVGVIALALQLLRAVR